MDQSEETIEIVLTVHMTIEDEYADLDTIAEGLEHDDQFRRDLEFVIETMLEDHRTDMIGHRPIDDPGFKFTGAFHHLWKKGFSMEVRADAWMRSFVDDQEGAEWVEF
jgi:hypothetical protein